MAMDDSLPALPPINSRRDPPVFDLLSDRVIATTDLQPLRTISTRSPSSARIGEASTARRHRSSSLSGAGSGVYMMGEPSHLRKEVDMDPYNSVIVSAVERTMKSYADNILRVLEGINGRLSQLESITEDLERSVASLKISVDDYNSELDGRLRMLNNRVLEMHRAVYILRDKQDIVEVQAELAKLHTSKNEALVEDSSTRRSAANESIDSSQTPNHQQQEQVPMHVATNTTQAIYATQLQVPLSHPQEAPAQNFSAVQLQPSLPPSFTTLPQQYFSVQGQLQQRPPQQVHLQSQSVVQESLPPQYQIHQPLPQPLPAQPQPMQTQQGPLQHIQTQKPMQQQAQGLQSLSQQVGMEQSQQHTQLQLLQQQAPGSQAQVETVQFQAVPQQQPLPFSVQVSQAQQTQSGHLPAQQEPLQQYFQHESQTYAPMLQAAYTQALLTQGGYSTESSYGSANVNPSQQQISPILAQRPIQLVPQNYSAHMTSSPSASLSPAIRPSFLSNATGNFSGPIGWNGQNTSAIPSANPRLPVVQPAQMESFSGGNLQPNRSPLDEVVAKVVAMGFPRDQVHVVIRRLMEKGQSIDMNAVLDTLMNGAKENQPQRGWQGR